MYIILFYKFTKISCKVFHFLLFCVNMLLMFMFVANYEKIFNDYGCVASLLRAHDMNANMWHGVLRIKTELGAAKNKHAKKLLAGGYITYGNRDNQRKRR